MPKATVESVRKKLGSYIFDEVIEWISIHLNPEQVFEEETLSDWAESSGYVKGDSDESDELEDLDTLFEDEDEDEDEDEEDDLPF